MLSRQRPAVLFLVIATLSLLVTGCAWQDAVTPMAQTPQKLGLNPTFSVTPAMRWQLSADAPVFIQHMGDTNPDLEAAALAGLRGYFPRTQPYNELAMMGAGFGYVIEIDWGHLPPSPQSRQKIDVALLGLNELPRLRGQRSLQVVVRSIDNTLFNRLDIRAQAALGRNFNREVCAEMFAFLGQTLRHI